MNTSSPERLDRVVEGSDALNRAVGEPLGERAIAIVEIRRCRAQRAIGVRVVLEDAQRARGTPPHARGLRPQAAEPCVVGHPAAPVGLHVDGLERAVVRDPCLPDRDAAAVQLRARADVRGQRADAVDELAGRAVEIETAVGGRDLGRVRRLALVARERTEQGRPALRRASRDASSAARSNTAPASSSEATGKRSCAASGPASSSCDELDDRKRPSPSRPR